VKKYGGLTFYSTKRRFSLGKLQMFLGHSLNGITNVSGYLKIWFLSMLENSNIRI